MEIEGKKYFHQYFEGEDNERMVFQVAETGMGTMLFYCTEGTAHGYEKIYPLEFNPETGAITDYLGNIEIDGWKLTEYDKIRNICIGKNRLAATIEKDGVGSTIVIDGATKKVKKLKDILSLQTCDDYELTEDSMILRQQGKVWKYNFDTEKSRLLCENVKQEEGWEKETDRLFRDSRDACHTLLWKENHMYVLDYATEKLIEVEGAQKGYVNCEINEEKKKAVLSKLTLDGIETKIVDLETGKIQSWKNRKGEETDRNRFMDVVWGNEDNLILEYGREKQDEKEIYMVYR